MDWQISSLKHNHKDQVSAEWFNYKSEKVIQNKHPNNWISLFKKYRKRALCSFLIQSVTTYVTIPI